MNNRRGIFQGLSPQLFVFRVVPLSFVLRKAKTGYEFKGQNININHLLRSEENSIRSEENSIGWYIKNAVEPMLVKEKEKSESNKD